jgi:hypothetical protein
MSVIIDGTAGVTFNDASIQNTAATGFGFKNRIINGAMVIDQRNNGASVTPANGQYLVDRWFAGLTQASKYSVQRNAGSVTPPAGFTNYLGVTSLSAYSITSGDTFFLDQRIEGLNCSDFAWGTASAVTVTLSFWVRSSLTGTFGGALGNSAGNRTYPFTYTISSANTWEQKSVTVPGDTTGTWLTTADVGINVYFNLGSGSTYSGTAGAWGASNVFSATGATSVVGTNGATLYITGVQLEKGSTATSFDYRPYGTELALCQRYFAALGAGAPASIFSGTSADAAIQFPVTMRATPSVAHLANYSVVLVATASYTVTNTVINASVSGTNTTGCVVRLTSSGMTAGNAWLTNGNNIGFSSEL